MMKLFLTILFSFSLITLSAQDKVIVKYYDTVFKVTSKENAAYSYEFADRDSFYNATAYYYPSKNVFSKCISLDTNLNSLIGLETRYYQSGKIKDSVFVYPKGRTIYEYHFYENGKKKRTTTYGKQSGTFDTWVFYESGLLFAHVYRNDINEMTQNEVFDEEGKQMPDYIYERPAEFPGGLTAWQKYLERNLDRDLPLRKGAPSGKYIVKISFLIDKEGNINNIETENDPGYGTKEEAIRVVKRGPKWIPAIKLNQPVIYRHKQGITFWISQ